MNLKPYLSSGCQSSLCMGSGKGSVFCVPVISVFLSIAKPFMKDTWSRWRTQSSPSSIGEKRHQHSVFMRGV